MAQYWVAALNLKESEDAAKTYSAVQSRLKYFARDEEFSRLHVPMDLSFRSFDSLIRLTDDLAKGDPQVETTLRRVEKQLREFTEDPEFAVVSRGKTQSWSKYMHSFEWDEGKYPKGRGITENLQLMLSTVGKLDEEVRAKLSSLQEAKTLQSTMVKEGSYGITDLISVLTPDKVSADDFVETEHLTTVVVVTPKDAADDLLASYEEADNGVVPETCKHLGKVEADKDGNSLYRIVLFKKGVPGFRQALNAKGKKFVVRDFTYSRAAYEEYAAKRKGLAADIEKQETLCKMVCKAAFSDMFLSWMHVKAMRTFVESVLRYGVTSAGSPHFVAMLMKVPTQAGQQASIRKELLDLSGVAAHKGDGDDEDFYPYVWVPMAPLSLE
jgi:V-type H+-transporting ATPase subunit C